MIRDVERGPKVALCRVCGGTGHVDGSVCRQCDGSGRVTVSCRMRLDIRPYQPRMRK